MAILKGNAPEIPSPTGTNVRLCGTPITVAGYSLRKQGVPLPADAMVLRPTFLPDTLGGEHILVHYVSSGAHAPYEVSVDTLPADGAPDYINRVLEIFEHCWDFETGPVSLNYLGFNAPPSDAGLGGDNRYDVYVMALDPGFFGFTSPDDDTTGYQVSSFITLENDFAGTGYQNNPLDAAKVTAAHEFFHAIQFGYDALEFDFDDPGIPATYKPWWLEASATWMEDQVYDDINDYINYLPFFYGYPWMGLGSFSYSYGNPRAYHPYASCVWPIYLTEKYGSGIVKEIWQGCASVPGYNTLLVTEGLLQSRGSSLSEAYLEFSVWNYHTGQRADTSVYFSEGALFPDSINITGFIGDLTSTPVLFGGLPNPPEHLGANYIVIRAGQDIGGIAVRFDGTDVVNAGWFAAIVGYRQGDSQWQDMFLVPNTGDGAEQWPDWNLYDEIVIIPTVSGYFPFYNSYTYHGEVNYDPSIVTNGGTSPEFKITKAYPSPFVIGSGSSEVTIPYSLDRRYTKTELGFLIYNSYGELVRELPKTDIPSTSPGPHSIGIIWDGRNDDGQYAASGIYILYMEGDGKSTSFKIAVVNNR